MCSATKVITSAARQRPCLLPPHLLERIARNGSPEQRARALATLATDANLRSARQARQVMRASPGRAPASGAPNARRTICDAGSQERLPGRVRRSEGAPATADAAVDEAYDGLGATHELYRQAFSRDSLDGRGLPLLGTVHYGRDYDNAFWDGAQMVFGDGDGDLFTRFTVSVDVIGHELTHGVTENEARLEYHDESGALNESISDVFGSLVKQQVLQQTADEADWLIGAGLLTANVHGVALRSMHAPGTAFDDPVLGRDDQPSHLRDYVTTRSDNGGVHTNSGIPNRAFYLAASYLGGFAWEKAGHIWYAALRDAKVVANTGFRGFARATAAAASLLFGDAETKAVLAGWAEVGVDV